MLAGCAVERRGEEHVAESSERISCTAVDLSQKRCKAGVLRRMEWKERIVW